MVVSTTILHLLKIVRVVWLIIMPRRAERGLIHQQADDQYSTANPTTIRSCAVQIKRTRTICRLPLRRTRSPLPRGTKMLWGWRWWQTRVKGCGPPSQRPQSPQVQKVVGSFRHLRLRDITAPYCAEKHHCEDSRLSSKCQNCWANLMPPMSHRCLHRPK